MRYVYDCNPPSECYVLAINPLLTAAKRLRFLSLQEAEAGKKITPELCQEAKALLREAQAVHAKALEASRNAMEQYRASIDTFNEANKFLREAEERLKMYHQKEKSQS